jgi:hypothetical protein
MSEPVSQYMSLSVWLINSYIDSQFETNRLNTSKNAAYVKKFGDCGVTGESQND